MAPIDDIRKIITDALVEALKDREGELRAIAEAGGAKAAHDPFGDVGDIASILNLLLNVIAITQPEFALPVAVKDAADAAGGKLGRGVGSGYFLGYMMFQFAAPYLNYITHAIADAAQSEIFDPATAAALVARGVIPGEFGQSEAGGGGFDSSHFAQMVDAAEQRPDVQTLMLLRNLDQVNDDDVRKALKRHGYPDFWIEPLFTLRRNLLSPADLALANLRGYLDDATMTAYARQLGVTDADMQVLIANTGEPPGPEQLMEALRRGFIDSARFERGIRQSRVRNEWIDVEHKLASSPMTTADAVRAVVENYITSDEGLAIALQNGLEAAHWPLLVESWGRPLAHEQMLTLYHRGQVTLDDVRQAMRESDVKNKYIDNAIELGRRLIPERTIVSAIDHGVLQHDEGVAMLLQLGFNDHDAQVLVSLGTAQRTTTQKHLSRADLVAMYEDKLLPKQDVVDRLVKLGYTTEDANAALELADLKTKAASVRAAQRSIEASLKAHHVTPEQARAALIKVGVSSEQAQGLVDEWLQVRGLPTRSLTEAQIVKLAGAKLITTDDALNRLKGLGLLEADARLWLIYEGVLPGLPGFSAGG